MFARRVQPVQSLASRHTAGDTCGLTRRDVQDTNPHTEDTVLKCQEPAQILAGRVWMIKAECARLRVSTPPQLGAAIGKLSRCTGLHAVGIGRLSSLEVEDTSAGETSGDGRKSAFGLDVS